MRRAILVLALALPFGVGCSAVETQVSQSLPPLIEEGMIMGRFTIMQPTASGEFQPVRLGYLVDVDDRPRLPREGEGYVRAIAQTGLDDEMVILPKPDGTFAIGIPGGNIRFLRYEIQIREGIARMVFPAAQIPVARVINDRALYVGEILVRLNVGHTDVESIVVQDSWESKDQQVFIDRYPSLTYLVEKQLARVAGAAPSLPAPNTTEPPTEEPETEAPAADEEVAADDDAAADDPPADS